MLLWASGDLMAVTGGTGGGDGRGQGGSPDYQPGVQLVVLPS